MKPFIVLVALVCIAPPSLRAQGQVDVRNYSPLARIDAPVFDVDGQTRLQGPAYVAQLYWGFSLKSLSPVGPVINFRTGLGAGYLTPTVVTIPGAPHGSRIYAQLRAWEARAGASFEAAVAAGGKYGVSNIVYTYALEPPDPPGELIGLDGFVLVPEPAPGPLLALGGLAWWLATRRRGFPRKAS